MPDGQPQASLPGDRVPPAGAGGPMKIERWEPFPDALRAALIQHAPTVTWRVTPARRSAVEGVTVGARRSGPAVTIWLPAPVIEAMTLHELLEVIHAEAERQFAVQRGT